MPDPLSTREVRWFFDGGVDAHPALKRWFEPTERSESGPPDVYLLVPDAADMGIKLRDGALQIKGRVAMPGVEAFGRHQGAVERWIKWSCPDLPPAYQHLFDADAHPGVVTVSVNKRRALRRFALDAEGGRVREIAREASAPRGIDVELSDLEIAGATTARSPSRPIPMSR
jgi:hypothetical protein